MKTKRMIKKHSTTIGIILAMLFLVVSTFFYPGGSQHDEMTVGFDWRHNYVCNLLNPVAVNGHENGARPWAVAGLVVLCATAALFFVRFSRKIPAKGASNIIKFAGVGAMMAAFLTATPYHYLAVTASGTLLMLTLFYITVFLFKSKLHGFKVLAVVCLLALYSSSFVYFTQIQLEWLPVLQKAGLVLNLALILGLEYFTKSEDFSSRTVV
ncbi:MAG: hypothetical protein IPM82_30665 [Saprospiraceae bacterium]|nr:hypothetical protein [Saprospiraceae bacterium]